MFHGLVCHVLTKVAGASDDAVEQLRSLSGFLVQEFCPTAPAGEVPTGMPAEIHFGAFIAAFMDVPEYGMEDAPVMCTHTVRSVREALSSSLSPSSCYGRSWRQHKRSGRTLGDVIP